MRSGLFSAVAVAVVMVTTSCGRVATAPSATPATSPVSLVTSLAAGTWASTTALPAQAQQGTCGGFTWNVSNITATAASGSFAATCHGVAMSGTGSAQATVSASGINWTSTGTASAPGHTTCTIALTGTLAFSPGGVVINYSGTTCLGSVMGTETLRRK